MFIGYLKPLRLEKPSKINANGNTYERLYFSILESKTENLSCKL